MPLIPITRWLLRQSKTFVTAVGFALALLVGAVDYLTGFELSVGVFYLAPVFLVSWGVGKNAAILLSVISAVLWLLADVGGGHTYSNPAFPFWNAGVRLGFFLSVAYLAWYLKEAQDVEKTLARIDPLTGIPNRRAFLEIADRESRRTRRHKYSVTVAYIDLDNFKGVNDVYGHMTGDNLLKVVARILQESVRDTDCIARLGGDEFAVLLPQTHLEGAKTLLEKLRSRLRGAMHEQGWPVTFSIGAITFSRPAAAEEMIQRADALMYSVKQKKKDNISWELTQAT
ncbi:MAG: diguanylate cyclase [Acidobacteria bacterium]|nr:diguanylate cyclase [Acidobacteriota bacterium]